MGAKQNKAAIQYALTAETNECILWAGCLSASGYPIRKLGPATKRKTLFVHRYMCEQVHGPAPVGKECALHSCDVRACFNPRHLRWGDRADNAQDAVARNRLPCTKGELSPSCKVTDREVMEIRRLYAETNLNQKEIADRFGLLTIRHIVSGRRGDHGRCFAPRKGVQIAHEIRREIRARFLGGESARSLAREFRLHAATVYRILHEVGGLF